MFFDDTTRQAESEVDLWLAGLADHLREHMLSQPEPLSEKRWRVAGYRFARSLAQERPSGMSCVREFAEGMRAYCNDNASIGGPVLYDVRRSDTVEEKAEKLLALASHKNTGDAEAAAALKGFAKFFIARDLAIITTERLGALGRTFARMQETMSFLRREHPTLFIWAVDDSNPSPITDR